MALETGCLDQVDNTIRDFGRGLGAAQKDAPGDDNESEHSSIIAAAQIDRAADFEVKRAQQGRLDHRSDLMLSVLQA